MSFTFRIAETDEDREAVYRLRYELYVEQQGLFGDSADHDKRFLCDEDDPRSLILLAERDGMLVGTARLTNAPFSDELRETYDMDSFFEVIPEERVCIGMRLLVRPELRGGPLAMRCMEELITIAAKRQAIVLANCEAHLINLYTKVGFRTYGELYNHPQNGVLVPIVLVTGDLDHLRTIRSPLLGALEKVTTQMPEEELRGLRALITDGAAVRSKIEMSTGIYMHTLADLLKMEGGLSGVIADLTPEESRVLIDMSHIMQCKPGDAIIVEGHVSRTLYLLLSGSLEIRRNNQRVNELDTRGTVVGEVAFFTDANRTSDVIAGPRGAFVLALNDRTLRKLMQSHGPVAAKFLYHVAQGLCQKLRPSA